MKKHAMTGLLALLTIALLAPPLLAQETVFGFFEGPLGGLDSGSGAITVSGWALADSGVWQVILQVDGIDVGRAFYGQPRPEVARLYPGYPDSAGPGFGFRINSTLWANGRHRVSAKVITLDGNVHTLDGTREIFFTNNTAILKPFGAIDAPQRGAQLAGSCREDRDAGRVRLTPIEGWVLDLGVETNDAGVGWVELMIDNQPVSNTRTGCFFSLAAGGLTNCYGLPRPEIERLYPFAKDAPNAGFRFVLDIGFLISQFGYTEGQHLLTIRSNDVSNQLADVDEIPVVFRCIEDINEPSYGRIESPRPGRIYSGDMAVQGWTIDWEGVDRVRVLIDGQFVGFAAFGAEDGIFETRPRVFSEYANFPEAAAPVWRLLPPIDTHQLSDGGHQLQVFVVDDEADRTLIGEVTFTVDNRDD